MPKQYQINENLRYMPQPEQSSHFLPALSSQPSQQLKTFHHHNRSHQKLLTNATQRHQRHSNALHDQQSTNISHSQQQPTHGSHTYQTPTNVSFGRPHVTSSVPSTSHVKMAHSDDSDHKLDRKSKARRQLVGGLISAASTNPGRPVQRSQSFNTSNYSSVNRSGQSNRSRDIQKRSQNKSSAKQNVSSRNLTKDRTREAIENWNDLVHELNLEQFHLQQNEQDHLAVLSDNSSEASFTFPIKDKKPDYSSQSPFKTFRGNTSLNISKATFPMGLGFTRYRPITPNLLDKLDKQKVAPRRRTQIWVNKLPDQRRSYFGSSFPDPHRSEEKARQENAAETKEAQEDIKSGSQARVSSSCTIENNGNTKRWHEFI